MRFFRFGHVREKVTLFLQIGVELVDQDADPVEPESFALVMEIEIRVMDSLVVHRFDRTLVSVFDGFLVTFLVDEVDEELVAVQFDLLLEMFRERLARLSDVHDLQIWLVTKVVDFGPVDGHAAASLDVAVPNVASNVAS